jgi:hypothetical protein
MRTQPVGAENSATLCDLGVFVDCDTRSHVVSELVEEVGLCRRRSYGSVFDLALAENSIHARQAACSYWWRIPPRRWCLRMLKWAIWSGSVIGEGSGWSGRALAMP